MKTMTNNTALVAKNTLWQTLGRAIILICSLITTYFLTRLLGVEVWGNYIFITNIILIAFNLADFGAGTITFRNLAWPKLTKNQKRAIFSQSLTIKLSFTSITLIILAILIFSLDQFESIRLPTLLSSPVIIFLSLRTLAEATFMAHSQFLVKASFETIAAVISIIGISLISQIYSKITLGQSLLIWGSGAAISATIAFISLKRRFPNIVTLSLRFNEAKKFLRQSAPIGIRQLVFALYDAGIDSFFLKTLIGSAAVGFYGLPYKIYTNLILGAAFFMNSLFPIIIKKGHRNINPTLKRGAIFLLTSGLAIGLLVTFSAPTIIKIIGGEAFLASVPVLRILMLALVLGYLNHLTGYTMIALRAEKQLLYFSLLALAINLAGNWLLIPYFGIIGAAWTTVATEASILFTTGVFLAKRLQSTR
jgi:O-antigen/teichoic acid export membrane protein